MKPKRTLHQQRWTLRLFEWGILSCVVLVLMGVFLRRVRHLQFEAERLTVQATVDNLRAAVLLATVLPRPKEAARPGGNPVALLKAETGLEPDGYIGELESADLHQIAPGQWYFDRSEEVLVYRVRSVEDFDSSLSGPARIRLCLRSADPGKADGASLQLEACEAYRWGPAN